MVKTEGAVDVDAFSPREQWHEAKAREFDGCLRIDGREDRNLDGQKREDRATKVIGACNAAGFKEGDEPLGKRLKGHKKSANRRLEKMSYDLEREYSSRSGCGCRGSSTQQGPMG